MSRVRRSGLILVFILPLLGPVAMVIASMIYVFGGTSPDPYAAAKKNVYVYDIETDTWAQKSDMPHAIALCGITVVDNTIYLIGGTTKTSNPPIARMMAYDLVSDVWTQKSNMPTARGFLSACTVDGKIYAIGGAPQNWGQQSYNHVEVYDPATDTWQRKSNMPTARTGLGCCVVDGRIFAIGGFSPTGIHAVNEIYDSILDQWTTCVPMQQRRLMPFVGSVGDKIYVVGGSYPDAQMQPVILSINEEYDTGLGVPSPDLNGDFVVNIEDLIILIEHWGQDEPACDIAPIPFGDGVVDELDLERMMSHWEHVLDDPTLMAHWTFDESEGQIAYDSAGKNDALVLGNAGWQPEAGAINGALQFDGVMDFVETPLVFDPAQGPFSIRAWMKGGVPGQVIASQQGGVNWLMTDIDTGMLRTDLTIPPVTTRGKTTIGPSLISSSSVTDGDWHRIVFAWDGADRILYVDEVEVARDETENLVSSKGELIIGAGANLVDGSFFSGLIDDVRIYDRVVTP